MRICWFQSVTKFTRFPKFVTKWDRESRNWSK